MWMGVRGGGGKMRTGEGRLSEIKMDVRKLGTRFFSVLLLVWLRKVTMVVQVDGIRLITGEEIVVGGRV